MKLCKWCGAPLSVNKPECEPCYDLACRVRRRPEAARKMLDEERPVTCAVHAYAVKDVGRATPRYLSAEFNWVAFKDARTALFTKELHARDAARTLFGASGQKVVWAVEKVKTRIKAEERET